MEIESLPNLNVKRTCNIIEQVMASDQRGKNINKSEYYVIFILLAEF